MERTTKQERKQNAKSFWHYLKNGDKRQAAIVVLRQQSKTNPNINRVQFITNRTNSSMQEVVIAESVSGITGCFYELINNIHGNIEQKGYFENGFEQWLKKECRMEITFNDGLVIMIRG